MFGLGFMEIIIIAAVLFLLLVFTIATMALIYYLIQNSRNRR